jgi:hypothetical protein
LDWNERLRNVEDILDDPEMRGEAARVRERARDMRIDFKRHSKSPNWELVEQKILRPLIELREQVERELLLRTGDDPLAPIDRDPVPAQFESQVKKYYERLGSGQ